MYTVEGVKDKFVLLTLLWRQANFIVAIKLDSKNSKYVNGFFYLKVRFGYEDFSWLFPIILTDNDIEFFKPNKIEFNGHLVYPTKLFYYHSGHSEQKGKIENNHEYIRRFIPKGISFNDYTQDDINLMMRILLKEIL